MRLAPRSVRGKAVLGSGLAIGVFGIAIGIGSYVIVSQAALTATSDLVATQVSNVSDQLAEQSTADVDSIDLESPRSDTPVVVQVVSPDGAIRQASPTLDPSDRICPEPLPGGPTSDRTALTLGGNQISVVRQTAQVSTIRGTEVVCAATSDQPVQRAQEAVLLGMLIVLPLLTLGVCVAVWLAVGRALGAVDDMTVQAEAMQSTADGELRVQATGDEVEHLGRTLNALLARLHHQTNATRQFVADAGHELRNPLSTLRVTLEFGAEADESALRASTRDALTDLDRLEHLVQDLLVLARTDATVSPVDVERLDFADLVREAADAAERSHPELAITFQGDSCPVQGSRVALRSLATNLIDNAVRHAAGEVSICVTNDGSRSLLRVDDDGTGLSPADCGRVFERFVRLDEARDRDEGGSGLGLSIVASVAESHAGWAEATPGPGGHFSVSLPLAQRDQPLRRAEAQEPP